MKEVEVTVRMWRMTRGIPGGQHVWFDPSEEYVRLFRRIPSRDGDGVEDSSEGLDSQGGSGYLDKVDSVSADGQGRGYDEEDRYEQLIFLEEDDQLPF